MAVREYSFLPLVFFLFVKCSSLENSKIFEYSESHGISSTNGQLSHVARRSLPAAQQITNCFCVNRSACMDQGAAACGRTGKVCCDNVLHSESSSSYYTRPTRRTPLPINRWDYFDSTTAPPKKREPPVAIPLNGFRGRGKPKPLEDKCGVSRTDLNSDLKSAAAKNEFPWTLVLKTVSDTGVVTIIGTAVLLEFRVAVTSASVIADYVTTPEKVTVSGGEWAFEDDEDVSENNVKSIIIHNNYTYDGEHNNIAVLFLDKAFNLAPGINRICRLGTYENVDINNCFETGWDTGVLKFDSYNRNTMNKIQVTLIGSDDCVTKLRAAGLDDEFEVSNTAFCGYRSNGYSQMSAGGNPLFCKKSDTQQFALVGIASWGITSNLNTPTVYTAATQFYSFIDKTVMENLGL